MKRLMSVSGATQTSPKAMNTSFSQNKNVGVKKINVEEETRSPPLSYQGNTFSNSPEPESYEFCKVRLRRPRKLDCLFNVDDNKTDELEDVHLVEETIERNDKEYVPELDIKGNISDEMMNVFIKFRAFLGTFDGGCRDSATSKQLTDDIIIISKQVGCFESFDAMLDASNFRDKYMDVCRRSGTQATSIRKYLSSLTLFVHFLLTDKVGEEMPGTGRIYSRAELLAYKDRILHWKRGLGNECKTVKREKEIMELGMLLTSTHAQKYDECVHSKKALKLFKESAVQMRQLTQEEYCCVRDHLFVVMHLGNGIRSGVTANMLIEEVTAARENGSLMEVRVKKHKTRHRYGPAPVTFTTDEFMLLKMSLKVREQIDSPHNNVFFILEWLTNGIGFYK